jgi:hypothetical protein
MAISNRTRNGKLFVTPFHFKKTVRRETRFSKAHSNKQDKNNSRGQITLLLTVNN